ncbi:hypothetical protein T11_7065 [Trichinella zimbabwensis]|uniref:Uncharacterized protein n=1 Tax=Trichinella zimbabwensis TaxID=268475 RepID=A0A0V1GT42_9BILA|nr:hypothetical protein T11_7065 [Trichinella zimbabwensis]
MLENHNQCTNANVPFRKLFQKFQAENELGDSFKMELIKHGYLINATLSEAIAAPSSKSQD